MMCDNESTPNGVENNNSKQSQQLVKSSSSENILSVLKRRTNLNIMNIDHLTHDEFKIECDVRNLTGPAHTCYQTLKTLFEEEARTPVIKPNRAHKNARKNPIREVEICNHKLTQIQTALTENNDDESLLAKTESRLNHVKDRLLRIQSSGVAKDSATLSLEVCIKLLAIVCEATKAHQPVNTDSIKEIIPNTSIQVENLEWESADEEESNASLAESVKPTQSTGFLSSSKLQTNCVNPNEPQAGSLQSMAFAQPLVHEPWQTIPIPNLLPNLQSEFEDMSEKLQSLQLQLAAIKPDPRYTADQFSPPEIKSLKTGSANFKAIKGSSSKPEDTLRSNVGPHMKPTSVYFSQPIASAKSASGFIPISSQIASQRNQNPDQSFLYNSYAPHTEIKLLRNWNIKYGGERKDRAVEKFLFQAEYLANAFNVSQSRLTKEFASLLAKDALEWYWAFIRRNFDKEITWNHLREEMLRYFRDAKTDDNIKTDFDKRQQNYKHNESFMAYFRDMYLISSSLHVPYSDAEFMRIVKKNMRPGLRIATRGEVFQSIDQMLHRCRDLEEGWKEEGFNPEYGLQTAPAKKNRIEVNAISNCGQKNFSTQTTSFQSPSSEDSNIALENLPPPLLQYYETPLHEQINNENSTRDSNISAMVQKQMYSRPYPTTSSPPLKPFTTPRPIFCYNCVELGHTYTQCPYEKWIHKFCKKCGFPNTEETICPRCKLRSGNVQGGSSLAGKSPLPTQPAQKAGKQTEDSSANTWPNKNKS